MLILCRGLYERKVKFRPVEISFGLEGWPMVFPLKLQAVLPALMVVRLVVVEIF